ncbi:MAG TPA: MBL fold metallo-hydrolase [Candidatus Dormibacteraeota bacterium]|nr:MBL fold metallo-hydrolase [Candidatus Dormibacteraeota bacterium]
MTGFTHAYICATCGVQYEPSLRPPASCMVCDDARQFIGWDGQTWTTLGELRADHANRIEDLEPGLTGIGTQPNFAIGQRALLVRTEHGNLLWDCITLIDDATVESVRRLGGIDAIAISHPHYYSAMIEWSQEFDARVYLHEEDRSWVMRQSPRISFWQGETLALFGGLSLVRLGGHFPGATVCHWPSGAGGAGAILSGDVLQVVPDRRFVSFMYSYPNLIPLPAHVVARIARRVSEFRFDRIYGAWWDRVVQHDGRRAVARSAERYLAALATEAEEVEL